MPVPALRRKAPRGAPPALPLPREASGRADRSARRGGATARPAAPRPATRRRHPALLLLREAPAGGERPDVGADESPDRGDGGRRIVCRACGQALTTEKARTERGGSHRHVFANPHGYVFDLALFSAAPGCRCEGPPSTEFPWFAGCAWQVALCRRCDIHLGWRFAPLAGGAAFYGLIADRLAEEDLGR